MRAVLTNQAQGRWLRKGSSQLSAAVADSSLFWHFLLFSALGLWHASLQMRDCDSPSLCHMGPAIGCHLKINGQGLDNLLRNQAEGELWAVEAG